MTVRGLVIAQGQTGSSTLPSTSVSDVDFVEFADMRLDLVAVLNLDCHAKPEYVWRAVSSSGHRQTKVATPNPGQELVTDRHGSFRTR